MSNVELPKVTERRLKAEDFRSEAFRRDAFDRDTAEDELSNLRELEEQISRRPIDEVAALVRKLTYGAMIELAEELWRAHTQGSDVSKDSLPGLLHRWSTTHNDEL
jgi:hypothetical protein